MYIHNYGSYLLCSDLYYKWYMLKFLYHHKADPSAAREDAIKALWLGQLYAGDTELWILYHTFPMEKPFNFGSLKLMKLTS